MINAKLVSSSILFHETPHPSYRVAVDDLALNWRCAELQEHVDEHEKERGGSVCWEILARRVPLVEDHNHKVT